MLSEERAARSVAREAKNKAIMDQLVSYNRGPFVEQLAKFLANGPSEAEIRLFAALDPGKWAKAVGDLAKQAGFTERTESLNVNLDITNLGDSEILVHMSGMIKGLREMGIDVLGDLGGDKKVVIENKNGDTEKSKKNKEIDYGDAIEDDVIIVD